MMVKKFRSINFNTFMLFMVNPFVSAMKDLEQWRQPVAWVLSEGGSGDFLEKVVAGQVGGCYYLAEDVA